MRITMKINLFLILIMILPLFVMASLKSDVNDCNGNPRCLIIVAQKHEDPTVCLEVEGEFREGCKNVLEENTGKVIEEVNTGLYSTMEFVDSDEDIQNLRTRLIWKNVLTILFILIAIGLFTYLFIKWKK